MSPPLVARGSYTGPIVIPEDHGFKYEIDLLEETLSHCSFFEERLLHPLLVRAMNAARSSNLSSFAPGGGGSHGSSRKPGRTGKVAKAAREPRDFADTSVRASPPRVLSLFGESLGIFCAVKGARVTCAQGLGCIGRARIESLAARNDCDSQVDFLDIDAPQINLLGDDHMGVFDIVLLQPPAFAPTYGRLEDGMQKYIAWTAVAAAAVRPQGLLIIVCRSRTMTAVRLFRSVSLGIWSAKRRAQVVHRCASAPPDFPVHLALPQTNEMQVMALRVR